MHRILLLSLLCFLQTTAFSSSTPISSEQITMRDSSNGQGIRWERLPEIPYKNKDLQGGNRSINLQLKANRDGTITSVSVVKSSGLSALDQTVVKYAYRAKFQPFSAENGVAYPLLVMQTFEFVLNENELSNASLEKQDISSKIKKKIFSKWDLSGTPQGLNAKISFNFQKNSTVTLFTIVKSSGNIKFDQSIQKAVFEATPFDLTDSEKNILFSKTDSMPISINFTSK
jgi:TonB family protein